MRKMAWSLVALLVLVSSAGIIYAGATPAQKCAVAKNKAAAKKVAAKLKCWQKAYSTGAASADADCLATAEAKFVKAIEKAEAKGGCVTPGDGDVIEGLVDQCVGGIVGRTPTVACQVANLTCKCGSLMIFYTPACDTPSPLDCTTVRNSAITNCALNGQPPGECETASCTDACMAGTCG